MGKVLKLWNDLKGVYATTGLYLYYRDSTRSLRVLSCISIRLSYANLIGIREMSERANDQLADLIGSECNGHMQAGIASVTPDLRHIRLFPEDWPLCIFC